jgi:hypothetical protein
MSDPVILRDEDVGRIGEYVKPWLRELVSQLLPRMEYAGVGPQLLERMVRVEEELKAQRELMAERFAAVDRRFVAVDQRFVAADQRLEALIRHMDRRFESVDKRFTALTWMIGVGFVVVTSLTTVFALLA